MRSSFKRLLSESALSVGANLVSMGSALLATYLFASLLTERGGIATAGLITMAAIVSTTWGSWIGLSWTRNRVLRGGMKAVTLLPGLVLLIVSFGGIYVGLGSLLTWLALGVSALGTLATAVLLWRELPRTLAGHARSRLAAGFVLFPLLTSTGAILVGCLWHRFLFGVSSHAVAQYSYLAETFGWNISGLISFSTVMLTVLAFELCTTTLPALISATCRDVSSRGLDQS